MAGETILVIDDTEDTLRMYKIFLELQGYSVLTADNGYTGIEMAQDNVPDLILLDYLMPQMNGITVLQQLREVGVDIPVIIFSAIERIDVAIDGFRLGIKDYIIKTKFTQPQILKTIQNVLQDANLKKENERLRRELLDRNIQMERQVYEAERLQSIGRSILALDGLDNILMRILMDVILLTRSQAGGIYLVENNDITCKVIKHQDDEQPQLGNGYLPPKEHQEVIEKVMETNDVVLIHPTHETDITSLVTVAIPMLVKDLAVGALVTHSLLSSESDSDNHQLNLLQTLADYAALAYENTTKYQASPDIDEDKLPKSKSIFVSYSHTDWALYVKKLVTSLRAEGMTVWIDQHLLEAGENWWDQVNEALESCGYMVLCVSPDSLSSKYVKYEYRYFIDEEKPILPVMCVETKLPPELRYIHYIPYAEQDKLVERIKGFIGD